MPIEGSPSTNQKLPNGVTTQKNEYVSGDVRIIDILKMRRHSQKREADW